MNIKQTLQELEERLLTKETRQNMMAVHSLLAEEFREFGSSGRAFSKAETLNMLQSEQPASLSLNSFEVFPLSEQAVLVTYRAVKDSPPSESMRSSIWVFRDERWQMLFHQGTKIT